MPGFGVFGIWGWMGGFGVWGFWDFGRVGLQRFEVLRVWHFTTLEF